MSIPPGVCYEHTPPPSFSFSFSFLSMLTLPLRSCLLRVDPIAPFPLSFPFPSLPFFPSHTHAHRLRPSCLLGWLLQIALRLGLPRPQPAALLAPSALVPQTIVRPRIQTEAHTPIQRAEGRRVEGWRYRGVACELPGHSWKRGGGLAQLRPVADFPRVHAPQVHTDPLLRAHLGG